MRVRAWIAEVVGGIGVVGVGAAFLALPRDTPFIGALPRWVGLALFALGLFLIVVSTSTYIYERVGSPRLYLRNPFYGEAARTGGSSRSAPILSVTHARRPRLITDRTPAQLTANFKNTTSVEGKDRIARYIGSWMRVAGPIRDVSSTSPTGACVTFANRSLFTYDNVYAWFRERRLIDRVRLMSPDEQVAVLGRITEIDSQNVTLDDCEIEN